MSSIQKAEVSLFASVVVIILANPREPCIREVSLMQDVFRNVTEHHSSK